MAEVSDLVKNITDDVKVLVRGEMELAKAELSSSAKNAGVGAGLFGAAGYLALNALSLLFLAGALAIALWIDSWPLGFVIMAGALLLIAGILALIGKSRVSKVKAPEQSIAEAKASADALKQAIARGKTQGSLPDDRRMPIEGSAPISTGASAIPDPGSAGPRRSDR